MVKIICFLIVVVLLEGCSKKLFDLTMIKTPYTGNELRIDGYYYSDLTSVNDIGVAVFYRDGFCIHTWVRPINQDTIGYIENSFLLNEAEINKIKNIPAHIGVFQVGYPSITFETWEFRIETFSQYGEILNDTTFLLTKRVNNNRTGKTFSENLIYRFKQFNPKPDSTNRFVQ